ncbi:MAG: SAVED domain-containing protein [Thermoanaerobaculia bacterium]|nr:SAVED domain-containing protein [Thermoanaerobaculia bacterium]
MTADAVFSGLEARDPAAAQLAMVASLAVEIEPALLRRLRRALVPKASALAEALLWSSDLVATRTPSTLLLHDDALVALRDRLRHDQDILDAARSIVERAHGGVASVLQCEEKLVYLGLVDLARKPRPGMSDETLATEVQGLLGAVLHSIRDEKHRRNGLLAWSTRALPSLPPRVQAHDFARTLTMFSSIGPGGLATDLSVNFPPQNDDIGLYVGWTTEGIALSLTGEGVPALWLRSIQQLLVYVDVKSDEQWTRHGVVTVPFFDPVCVPVEVSVSAVRLRSIRGDGIILERRSVEPLEIQAWVAVAGTPRFILPPGEVPAAEALGAALAERGLGLVTGAFEGADHVTARSFFSRRVVLGGAGSEAKAVQRVKRVVRRGRKPDFEWGEQIVVEAHEEAWETVTRADAVIVMGTDYATREVALAAGRAGRPVFAFPETNADGLPGVRRVPSKLPEAACRDLVAEILAEVSRTSAVRLWAGDKIMKMATRYLRPGELAAADSVAKELRAVLGERFRRSEARIPDGVFSSNKPPERVIGYICVQVAGTTPALSPMMEALAKEVSFARDFYETRPLWQGLLALEAILRRVDPPIGLAARLRGILLSLESLSNVDEGGECKQRFREIIAGPAQGPFDRLGREYEQLRVQLAPGPERTRAMNRLFNSVERLSRDGKVTRDQIEAMSAAGTEGLRVVALACCAGRPEEAPVNVVAKALQSPRSPFEQWSAVLASQAALAQLSLAGAAPFAEALLYSLEDGRNLINDARDSSRRLQAEGTLEAYGRRVGFRSGLEREALRIWLSAKAPRVDGRAPCVAVFGSSPEAEFVPLCRALGGRLAAHGWHLAIGRGRNVGPEITDAFLKAASSGVTVYTTSGRGEQTEFTRVFRTLQEARTQMVADSDTAIVIAGSNGTLAEVRLAEGMSRPVLPVAYTGGTAQAIAREAQVKLRRLEVPDFTSSLLNTQGPPEDAAERIVRALNLVASQSIQSGDIEAVLSVGPSPTDAFLRTLPAGGRSYHKVVVETPPQKWWHTSESRSSPQWTQVWYRILESLKEFEGLYARHIHVFANAPYSMGALLGNQVAQRFGRSRPISFYQFSNVTKSWDNWGPSRADPVEPRKAPVLRASPGPGSEFRYREVAIVVSISRQASRDEVLRALSVYGDSPVKWIELTPESAPGHTALLDASAVDRCVEDLDKALLRAASEHPGARLHLFYVGPLAVLMRAVANAHTLPTPTTLYERIETAEGYRFVAAVDLVAQRLLLGPLP